MRLVNLRPDLHQENRGFLRILLVVIVMADHFELVILRRLWRMAMLACVASRAHAIHRRSNRAVIRIRSKPKQLAYTCQLVLNEGRSAPSDVTIDARNSGVTRILIPDIFWSHNGMTRLPAKFLRIHIADAVICRCGKNAHIRERRESKCPCESSRPRCFCGHALEHTAEATEPARCEKQAERHEKETQDE